MVVDVGRNDPVTQRLDGFLIAFGMCVSCSPRRIIASMGATTTVLTSVQSFRYAELRRDNATRCLT